MTRCRCRVVAPFRFQPTRGGLSGLGATTGSVASTAAQGASAGSVVGPVGSIVGGVVGAIVGLFGGKSNPQIAIDKSQAINLFNQYANVAGTVSGRSIGISTMNFVMRGAMFTGHFPKCQSTGWIDMLTMQQGKGGGCDNCFGVLWQSAKTGAQAPGGSGKNTGNGGIPVRDAKTFVDRYVWPSNSPDVDTVPWVTSTDAIGKQIVYDAADAYLAEQDATTLPLIGQTVQAQANVVLPTIAPASSPPPPAPATVNPTGSPTAPPAQSVTSPPAIGTQIYYAPDMSTANHAPFQLGPGYTFYGLDPDNGSWLLKASSGPIQVLWRGQIISYQPGMFAASVVSAPTVNPVGSPTAIGTQITPATLTPAQLVSQPPSLGTMLVYAPDKGMNGAPIQLPSGFIFQGLDPNNQSWILQNYNDGKLYVVWQGNVIPYTAGMFSPAGSVSAGPSAIAALPVSIPPATTVATTSSGVPVTQADIQALISQLQSQGQTAQQAYTSALSTLGSQGVAPTPAVQSAVQSAVEATPATAGAGGTGWLGLGAIALTLMFATAHPARGRARRRSRR